MVFSVVHIKLDGFCFPGPVRLHEIECIDWNSLMNGDSKGLLEVRGQGYKVEMWMGRLLP